MAPPYKPSAPTFGGLPLPPGGAKPKSAKPRTAKVRTGATIPASTLGGLNVDKPRPAYTTVNASTRPDDRGGIAGAGKAPKPKAPPKPKQTALPATSGHTPAPARVVTTPPHVPPPAKPPKAAKPTRKPSVVPKKTPPKAALSGATLPGQVSLTPAQEADLHVRQLLAPQYSQAATAAASQNAAITAFTKAMIAAVQGEPGQVDQEFNSAIGQQSNLAQAAAQALVKANPDAQNQALLQSIGAPAAQGAQLAQQNQNVFQGGAGVGLYTNGFLPTNQLQGERLEQVGLARQQPFIETLRGQQSLASALQQQLAARAAIAAQAPQLTQQWLSQFQTNKNQQAQLALERSAAGLKQQNQAFTQGLDKAKLQYQIDSFNARQTATANKIDVAVSKSLKDGFAHNSTGAIVYSGGKPLTFNTNGTVSAKTPTPAQINTLVGQWRNGKVQNVNVLQPNPDSNGNPVYRSVSTQTGTLQYGQAYSRLRAMGVGDLKARQYLDTAYMKGQQGRSWLTNSQQSALRAAGLTAKAKVVKDAKGRTHGLLTLKQADLLHRKNLLPKGQQTSDGFYVIAQTF